MSTGLRIMFRVRNFCGDYGRKNSRQQGFSLVELMIALVLGAILTTIGVPTFRSFILEQRLRATSTDLRIAMTTARSEAVKRNRTIELKANAGGWSDGWTIESPTAGDPDILNHKQAGDVTITSSGTVKFTPAGRASTPPGLVHFEIDSGSDAKDNVRWACLERQLDGRIYSCRMRCPVDANESLPEPCPDV